MVVTAESGKATFPAKFLLRILDESRLNQNL
jgi:hypothetical protein